MPTRTKKQDASSDGSSEQRSTVQLIKDIADDTTTLVKQELQLFKQEMSDAISARLKAAAAFAAAGLLAMFVIVFLGLAAADALSGPLPSWAARLIVAGAFLLLALVAVLFAKRRLKAPSVKPEETVRTVKEDVEWAKEQLKR